MTNSVTIFAYCERGSDPSFWAEPLNAITNGGFILAAFAGIALIAALPRERRSAWYIFFILNFIAIGIGSFLFHTVPNTRTVAADTIPIGIFMITYLAFALRRLIGASLLASAAGIALFIAAMVSVSAFPIHCWDGGSGTGRCLNGGLGYVPALLAMWIVGGVLARRHHPAARLVILAGCAFLVSLALRTIDFAICPDFVFVGHRMGTHFAWHLLNSLTLFLLLLAAIRYGHQTSGANLTFESRQPRTGDQMSNSKAPLES